MTDDINVEEERMTFRTPGDWGVVTGALLLMPNGKFVYRDIDPESGDLKLTTDV